MYNRKHGMMAGQVFERAVEECRRAARAVELGFFGEQTLHPNYLAYIAALGRPRPFRVETNTNLTLATIPMMRAWIDAELDLVRLSIDAITPEAYNRVRPGLARDLSGRRVEGVQRVAAVNRKIETWLAMPDHRPTRLVVVDSSHNVGQIEPFVEHWRPKLGPADQILIKNVLSYGGKIADPKLKAGRCNVWQVRYAVIDWAGNLSPCNLDTNMDLTLGNIMTDSIASLYYGRRADALRGRTGCGNDLTPCRTCTDANQWSENRTVTARDGLRKTG